MGILSKYIEEIETAQNKLIERNTNVKGANDLLFAYRGETRDHGKTNLKPSLFRKEDDVQKEKYLFELLGDYNVVEQKTSNNFEMAIEAQHYVELSRLLDITFSVLPAIYFACQKYDDKDGKCYVFAFPQYYSPHSSFIGEMYPLIINGKSCIYDKNFRVVTHGRYNERMTAQDGGFIFFPGSVFYPINPIYYEEIVINAEDKKDLRDALLRLFNIEEAKIFPSKENRAKLVKRKFDALNDYQSKEITIESEIIQYFARVDFELETKLRGMANDTDKETIYFMILRYMRKEKEDLCSFVTMYKENELNKCLNIDEEDKVKSRFNSLNEDINKNFEILRRSKEWFAREKN